MTGWKMYSRIHQLKESGFKKHQIAVKLGIDPKTVTKYWDMSPDEYHKMLCNSRERPRYLDLYEDQIVRWLKQHPDMTSAQVFDWLKQYYPDFGGKDRTIRDYVAKLRETHQIPKRSPVRQYQAVPDGPMGYQAQVDMGEKILYNADGTATKLYCMAVVLSHSRYKYAEWSDKPLNTARLVHMLNRAFEYIGGVPKELVFDQDKLVAVSENYGDIIYTQEFENYRQGMKFKIYLCRGADPESKGKIEAVVKYVKNNFAAHRTFVDLASFNNECLEWLKRTGNATVHGITKKIPAEVFLLEKQYLQPISTIEKQPISILARGVRKDNTILYLSNRYSVPIGTYRPGKQLYISLEDDKLIILDQQTHEVVATHNLCNGKGQLVQNNNHLRDHSKKLSSIHEQTFKSLGSTLTASTFLAAIKREKPRYIRDQLLLINNVAINAAAETIVTALEYCVNHELWSAVEFRDAVEYFLQNQVDSTLETTVGKPVVPVVYKIKATTRDINEYVAIYGGGKNE